MTASGAAPPVAVARPHGPAGSGAPAPRRADVQGLRAVAVLLVVAAHAGVPGLGGGFVGVDVFFVVSGFLITGLLLDEVTRTGRVSLAGFWARRARRILPAAVLTLVVTVLAALALLGPARAAEVSEDAAWASVFAVNWHLAAEGTAYGAASGPVTPLQHYWSLAVEEQFYLGWPLLVAALLGGGALAAGRRRAALGAVVVVGGVVSFVHSVRLSADEPVVAYFATSTRVWELAVGAGLALAAGRLHGLAEHRRDPLASGGLAAVVVSAVAVGAGVPFPGAVAAVPVLGAAAVLAAGTGDEGPWTRALLGVRPLQWVGDRSYALYLWHWPVLVLAQAWLARGLSAVETLGLVAATFLLSDLSYRSVERPLHRGRLLRGGGGARPTGRAGPRARAGHRRALWLVPASPLLVGLLALAVVAPTAAGAGSAAGGAQDASDDVVWADAAAVRRDVRAQVLERAGRPVPDGLAPPLTELRDDRWIEDVPDGCVGRLDPASAERRCTLGDPSAGRTVVLYGDSRAGVMLPLMERVVAEDPSTRVVHLVGLSCPVPPGVQPGGYGDVAACDTFRQQALAEVERLEPDVVVTTTHAADPAAVVDGRWADGLEQVLRRLRAAADRVVLLSETTTLDVDPVQCLGRRGAQVGDCTRDVWPALEETNEVNAEVAERTGADFVDLTAWHCAEGRCPAVVGGVAVYFDTGHFSSTFVEALAPALVDELQLQADGAERDGHDQDDRDAGSRSPPQPEWSPPGALAHVKVLAQP